MSKSRVSRGAIFVLICASATITPAQSAPTRDLTEFNLEDLMNVQVTSVSKKEQIF